jgi:methyl-accepting chemotaxis protein
MVLSKVSVPGKLILSSLIFTIPLAIMAYFIVSGIQYDIRFNEKEAFGAKYIDPLVEILARLPEYSRATGSNTARADAQAKALDAAFSRLIEAQAKYDRALAVTPEGLAERGRERLDPAKLKTRWESVKSSGGRSQGDAAPLAADVRELIVHVGDSSNLILDPDLDTYYLMDVSLLALPDTIVRLNAERDRQGESREDLAVFLKLHVDVDSSRVAASSQTALAEDSHFLGSSPSLQKNLPSALTSFEAASTSLVHAGKRLQGTDPETTGAVRTEYADALDASLDACLSYWHILTDELSRLLDIRIQNYRNRLQTSLAATAAAVIIAYLVVWAIARNLLLQIGSMRRLVSSMADKDLREKTSLASKDELGATASDMARLARELNASLKAFLGSVQSLDRSSDNMSASSSEMMKTSESLAASVEEIAASVEESMGTMSSIRHSIDRQFGVIDHTTNSFGEAMEGLEEVAKTMERLESVAQESGRTAEEGESSIASLIEESRNLGEHARSLGERVTRIDESTRSISEMMNAIGDIADRTGLLAMNASIEAAHAGAAGRGFSVVALSIRELASSTTQTLAMIKERTENIREAVVQTLSDSALMDKASGEVAERTSTAEAALGSIKAAVSSLSKDIETAAKAMAEFRRLATDSLAESQTLKDFSETIRQAVEEQDLGSKEIVKAIQELRGASVKNAESSESLAALSSSLKDESRNLDGIVREFTLDEADPGVMQLQE